MTEATYEVDEIISVCIARNVQDGEILAQGLATPLVAAGYLLASRLHAPNVYFASAIGQSVCRRGVPLGLATVESLLLDQAMMTFGFTRAVADLLPALRPKEYFRPGQVDQHGNFNNIAFGRNYRKPRLRLPGVGGIPDVTTYMHNVYLYVPRHSRVTFVRELDFHAGLGHVSDRRRGAGPKYLISDLGQFDFAQGRMRLTHLHPGQSLERVQLKTGFPLDIHPNLQQTVPPSAHELELLRKEIDPLRIRRLELLSGPARRRALAKIIGQERV